jgi:hypothetical protein
MEKGVSLSLYVDDIIKALAPFCPDLSPVPKMTQGMATGNKPS